MNKKIKKIFMRLFISSYTLFLVGVFVTINQRPKFLDRVAHFHIELMELTKIFPGIKLFLVYTPKIKAERICHKTIGTDDNGEMSILHSVSKAHCMPDSFVFDFDLKLNNLDKVHFFMIQPFHWELVHKIENPTYNSLDFDGEFWKEYFSKAKIDKMHNKIMSNKQKGYYWRAHVNSMNRLSNMWCSSKLYGKKLFRTISVGVEYRAVELKNKKRSNLKGVIYHYDCKANNIVQGSWPKYDDLPGEKFFVN